MNSYANQQANDLFHELETDISKLLDLKEEHGFTVTEIRDHLMELYQKVISNMLKKH